MDEVIRQRIEKLIHSYERQMKRNEKKEKEYEGDGCDKDGKIIYDTWICPCCGERYEVDYDDYEHCPKCGQVIDWSEEDETD